MKPLTPARFAAAEWLESKINAWDAAVSADPPDLTADLPPLPGDVSYAAFLGALREMVAGVVVAPKPTLDLPPAPEGMAWGRWSGGSVVHAWQPAPLWDGAIGLARACYLSAAYGSANVKKTYTQRSRPCTTCLAIATEKS